ncbi:AIPR family protein [Nocardiopsis flavescens]|nr:AIPR family protein [Nocardiopsis flavescens]
MSALSADQLVVKSLFGDYCATEYPGEDPDDVFEKYGATQVLKPKELTTEELSAGIVDGDKDGGVDSFFVFLNGALLNPDDPVLKPGDPALRHIGSHPELEIFLVQSKNKKNWEESVWEKLLSSLANLLDTNAEDTELEDLYRPSVVERTGILRKAIKSLAAKFPKVTFRVVYVTQAPEANLTETVRKRGEQVASLVRSRLTTGALVTAEHVGVEALYKLAGTEYSKPGILTFRHLIREDDDSFLGVASLEEYLKFIRNESGSLREEIFDSNVRDYEGDNTVNAAIGSTLESSDGPEFWWLNNGVTVLGDDVDSPQSTLTISRPLIVNGLQTSHVLHKADRDGLLSPDRLNNGVVVRVIKSVDEDTRDRIIAGTNRQTRVPGPALYATQSLQRDIERFLLVHDWYYERRKNRYKNQGMPAKRRITIGLLGQALITLKLGQPDAARARPSTLLSRQEGYNSLFPENMDRNAYLTAIEVIKSVDQFLSTEEARSILDDYTNARFYVAAGYLILELQLKNTSDFRFEVNFRRLARPLKTTLLSKALTVLATTAESFQSTHPRSSRDSVFKSSDFRRLYFQELTKTLKSK